MRVLSTKGKLFSWIYVSLVLAQPDTNSSETLSDGERKPAANATRQDRSLSAKCSELQLVTGSEELTVPGVKTGQECGSCLQCHSSDLAHLSDESYPLPLAEGCLTDGPNWAQIFPVPYAPTLHGNSTSLGQHKVPLWHSSNELQDHLRDIWQQPETTSLGTKHPLLNLYHL